MPTPSLKERVTQAWLAVSLKVAENPMTAVAIVSLLSSFATWLATRVAA